MSHTVPTGEGFERTRAIIEAGERGMTPPDAGAPPIQLVDVYVATFHVQAEIVLSSRNERALREMAEWLDDSEEHALLAETFRAFADQRNAQGIQRDDVKAAHKLSGELMAAAPDRFRELATVDPRNVL
jgi:hypothetical protein